MKIVISSELTISYNNYVIKNSIASLAEVPVADIECIVMHKLTGVSPIDINIKLADLVDKGFTNFVYVCEELVSSTQAIILGCGGRVYTDEFYLESDEDLDSLFETALTVTDSRTSLAEGSISILKDFFTAIQNGDGKVRSPIFVEQAIEALDLFALEYYERGNQLQDVSESSVQTFLQVREIFNSFKKHSAELKRQLDNLQKTKTESDRPSFGAKFYPRVRYVGSNRVLYIHELSHCPFLTTFMMAYARYLRTAKNIKSKLVFLVQSNPQVYKKYSSMATVGEANWQDKDILNNDIIAISAPYKRVVEEVLRGTPYVIIIDRLYRGDPFLEANTDRVKMLYAVSGYSDVTRYNLNISRCIFPINGYGNSFINIPYMDAVAKPNTREDIKQSNYNKTCLKMYEELDKLFIEGR